MLGLFPLWCRLRSQTCWGSSGGALLAELGIFLNKVVISPSWGEKGTSEAAPAEHPGVVLGRDRSCTRVTLSTCTDPGKIHRCHGAGSFCRVLANQQNQQRFWGAVPSPAGFLPPAWPRASRRAPSHPRVRPPVELLKRISEFGCC